MTTNKPAESLPAGSVVVADEFALFRVADGIGFVWHSTLKGRRFDDEAVDEMLASGAAAVLRVGA